MSGIEQTLTKKLGPLPTWAWVLVGAAGGYLLLKRKSATATAAQVASGYLGTGGAGGPAVSPSGSSVITPAGDTTVITPQTGPTPWRVHTPGGTIISMTNAELQAFFGGGGWQQDPNHLGSGADVWAIPLQRTPLPPHNPNDPGGSTGGGGHTTSVTMPDGSVQQLTDDMLRQFFAAGYGLISGAGGLHLVHQGSPSLGSVASSLSSGGSGAPRVTGDYGSGRVVDGVVWR